MVEAAPSGMRATASKNSTVSPADATPSTSAAPRSARLRARSRGRATTNSTTAAQTSRSHAVPAGPSAPNSGRESAAPSCTESMEAMARAGAGTRNPQSGESWVSGTATTQALAIGRVYHEDLDVSSANSGQWRDGSPALRVLVELAERGTLRAVAAATGYGTSAVSQQLAGLERAAGARLVEPDGRRLRLTPAGKSLLPHARRILVAIDEAKTDLASGEPAGQSASPPTAAHSMLISPRSR